MTDNDLCRKYLDRAYRQALSWKSTQTKFLHISSDGAEGVLTEANLLFSLLLLRRKTHESIQEGKELLTALLHFQNLDPALPGYGNFPVLLTDYPACQDWVLPLRIALIFSLILREFSSILGRDLEECLGSRQELLIQTTLANMQRIRFPAWALVTVPILQGASAEECLSRIEAFFAQDEQLSPEACGRVLVVASLCGSDVFAHAVERARSLWNGKDYVGPPWGIFSFQMGTEVTLFELIMSLVDDREIAKPWSPQAALACALLPSFAISRGVVVGREKSDTSVVRRWSTRNCHYAVALCGPKPIGLHGFHPIRIVTEHATIVIHTPGGRIKDIAVEEGGFVCTVGVDQVSEDDPSIMRLWVERNKAVSFDGKRASVFDPTGGLQITCGAVSFRLTVVSTLTLIGRVLLQNRPGQLCRRQKGLVEAYDWRVNVEHVRGCLPSEYLLRVERLE